MNIKPDFSFSNATLATGSEIYEKASFSAENQSKEIVDLQGKFVIPGFIDTHIHGFGKHNFELTSCDFIAAEDDLKKIGTTSFMPTVCPIKDGRIKDYSKATFGKGFVGFHLEGPFINPDMRGGFQENQIIPYTSEMAKRILDAFGGKARIMTVAPEMIDDSLTEIAKQFNCILSAGHTNASYAKMKSMGILHTTHLFNAMSRHHHRLPSVWDNSLLDDDIICEVIGDLHHVSKQSLSLALKCKPQNGLIAITDSICIADSPELIVKSGLVYNNDTIYGSQCSMAQIFKNLVTELSVSLPQAIKLTSQNAAELFSIPNDNFIVLNQDYMPDTDFLLTVEITKEAETK